MVGELYDYMVGIVIVGVIFTAAVFTIPSISYVNLLQVNQQQLRNTALNVFNAMLLGTGCPSDWGSRPFPFDQNNVEVFGLAYSEASSLYVLDMDKVQRLDGESPWHIDYPYVRDLLRLGDYGFRLAIFRPFTVDWDLRIIEATKSVSFSIVVTRNEDGRPIANARVGCTILCSAKKERTEDEPMVVVNQAKTFFTNALGKCGGLETMQIPDGYTIENAVAVLKITVAGISTMVVANSDETMQNFLKINTFGDTITLTFRGELADSEDAKGERRVKRIMTYTYDDLEQIFEGTGDPTASHVTHGIGFDYWNKTFPGLRAMDPSLLLFVLSVPNPRRQVIVVGPFSFWESSNVFRFGPDPKGDVVVQLRRYVAVSSMTYIAELTLWKE